MQPWDLGPIKHRGPYMSRYEPAFALRGTAHHTAAVDIAVVGAGRAGTAFAVLLARAGHRIVAVSGRDHTALRAGYFLRDTPVLRAGGSARASGSCTSPGQPVWTSWRRRETRGPAFWPCTRSRHSPRSRREW